MARKEKKKRGRVVVTGGLLGLLLLFLFNGGMDLNVGNPSGQNTPQDDQTQVSQDLDQEVNMPENMVVEIVDNVIYVNEEEVPMDQVLATLGEVKQVILRADEAKQVIYDEVKTLLAEGDIVIVEE